MAWKQVKLTAQELNGLILKSDLYRLVWNGQPESEEEKQARKAERLRRRQEVDCAYGWKPLPFPDDMT